MGRALRLSLGAILSVVGFVMVIGGAYGETDAAAVSASALPPGFSPSSFTAINDRDWWVLGGYGCAKSASKCDAAIARTTNGGRSFTRIASPAVHQAGEYEGHAISGVSQIAFANSKDGWADGTRLWSTHTGGKTWTRVPTPGPVDEVAAAGGYVYAAVDATASTRSGFQMVLWRSSIDKDDWKRLDSAGSIAGGLAAHGDEVLVQGAVGDKGGYAYGPDVLVSHDAGRRFTRYRAANPSLGNQLDPTSSSTVWDLGISGGPSGTVFRSVNGGRSFRDVQPSAADEYPNGTTVFAAASNAVAVLALNSAYATRHGSFYRTTDGGTKWTLTGPRKLHWTYVGFTNPTHGAGIALHTSSSVPSLYYTSNGGTTYRRISIP